MSHHRRPSGLLRRAFASVLTVASLAFAIDCGRTLGPGPTSWTLTALVGLWGALLTPIVAVLWSYVPPSHAYVHLRLTADPSSPALFEPERGDA